MKVEASHSSWGAAVWSKIGNETRTGVRAFCVESARIRTVPATRHAHGENMFGALGKCNSRTPFSSAPLTRVQVCMVRAFSSRWRLRIGDWLSCFRWRIPRKSFFRWWWTWKALTGLLFGAGTYWKSNDNDHAERAQVCLIGHIAVLCSWVSLALIRSIWCGGEGDYCLNSGTVCALLN